eukprot:5322218-Pyramimonas_sp.AAC.1
MDTTDGDAVITTQADISKCFDNVMWIKIIRAAQHYCFPTDILTAVLSKYMAPKRIRWGTTYSYAVWAMAGALPGCTIAMYLLQLTMMMPFD